MPPLADQVRPTSLAEFRGQGHLLGEGQPLRRALDGGMLHSMVLWGPPGSGKTTLARMLATNAEAQFISFSAVLGGVKDIRAAVEGALPPNNVWDAARYAMPGIVAHESAKRDGELLEIPDLGGTPSKPIEYCEPPA